MAVDKTIKINNDIYTRVDLRYKLHGENNDIRVYTTTPYDIDAMINRLVDYKAKEMAKEKLNILVSEKVKEFLHLT